jgi:WD40 repeat protein
MPARRHAPLTILAALASTWAITAPATSSSDGKHPQAKEARAGTDRYGDPLPHGALARLGTVRFRHTLPVTALAFAPEGSLLGSIADREGLVHLWDSRTGKQVRQLGDPARVVESFAFAPDGKTLALAYESDPAVRLLDVLSGKEVRVFPTGERHGGDVAFSPDGKALASAGAAALWDTASGEVRCRLAGEESWAPLAFSPDSKTLVTASYTSTVVCLWDTATGKKTRTLTGHDLQVSAVAFAPDGKTVASGDYGEPGVIPRKRVTVRLWDVPTGRQLRRLRVAGAGVLSLVFSRDGSRILAGGHDEVIRAWDVSTGQEVCQLPRHPGGVLRLALPPDGKLLAFAGANRTIRLWDVDTGREVRPRGGHQGQVSHLAFSAGGTTIVTASPDGTIRHWEAATGKELSRLDLPQEYFGPLAISPDGKVVTDLGWSLWDTATGRELRRLPAAKPREKWCAAFSGDGKLLATASGARTIQLWDVARGKALRRWKGGGKETEVEDLAISADGRRLAYANGGGDIYVYDAATGREIQRVCGPPYRSGEDGSASGGVECIALSPDGRTLVVGSLDHPTVLVEILTGQERARLAGHQGYTACLAFSHDGRLLASGGCDGAVRLWALPAAKERCRFRGHQPVMQAGVACLAFSPDGGLLASGGDDTTALVWDVAGSCPKELPPGPGLTQDDLQAAWAALAGADAVKGYRALATLVASPASAVPFLKGHLARRGAEAARLAGLIADLGSERYAVRQRAAAELEELGDLARPALRRARKEPASEEVRRRVDELLAKLHGPVSVPVLRALRAVEALEGMRTPEAESVLRDLARGAPGARVTEEARASLERLSKRPARDR